MVRGKVCVGGVGLAWSMVLARGHLRRPIVVHVGSLVMWQVIEAIKGWARGGHRIHIVTSNIDGASLHTGSPVGHPIPL